MAGWTPWVSFNDVFFSFRPLHCSYVTLQLHSCCCYLLFVTGYRDQSLNVFMSISIFCTDQDVCWADLNLALSIYSHQIFFPFLACSPSWKCIHWFWELDMIIRKNLRFAAVLFSIFYHPEFFSNSEIPWAPSDATTKACLPRDKVPHCQAQSISQALPEPLIEEALMGGEVSLDGRFAVFSQDQQIERSGPTHLWFVLILT